MTRSASGQCLTCSPRAWDYPPQGMIIASCDHRVFDDCGEDLATASYETWSDGSYGPAVSYGSYCPWCAIFEKIGGYFLPDEAAERQWLSQVAAQVDRNPKGHDAEERHGAKHESPVANGDAPQVNNQGGDA